MNNHEQQLLFLLAVFGPALLIGFFFVWRGEMKYRKQLKEAEWDKKWITDSKAKGIPGKKIVKDLKKWTKKYSKKYGD